MNATSDQHPRDPHQGTEVFEILAREHSDMLTAYLRSLVRAPDVVDDLFQETMLVAWRRLADYDRTRPFGPWLRGIATRLVLQHRRRSARDLLSCDPLVLEALDRRYEGLSKLPGDSFRERSERLTTCLKMLPSKLREAVELTYARGLMIKDVAAALAASDDAIKKRLQRARTMLAECLTATPEIEP